MPSRLLLIALLLVGCADPVLAQEDPRETAQEALVAGDASRAVAILQEAVNAAPEDADLLRRLASAYAADGDLDTALTTIDRALQLAPQDNDIRLARARILLWSERQDEAMQQAEQVALADPDYPELAEVIASIRASRSSGPRGGIAVSAGISQIDLRSGTSNSWERLAADVFLQFDTTTAAASIEHEERAVGDTRLGVRLDRRTSFGSLYIGGAVTPSADFREEWSLSGGGEVRLAGNLTAHIDMRHSEYSANAVTSFQPGVTIAASPALSFTGRSILLLQSNGALKGGGSLRTDYRLPSGSSLFLGGAVYPDTEAGITRTVSSVFGGAAIALTDTLALRVAGEYETRRQSYSRKGLTLGISWRFGP